MNHPLKKNDTRPLILVLLGPTGSGKTALATRFDPQHFEVISCDARQVYRGLEIASAAPSVEERASMPHHLIGIIEPDRKMNAAFFVAEAEKAVRDIQERGKTPILTGGSGFYYRAFRRGLFPTNTTVAAREKVARMTPEERLETLRRLDPESLQPDAIKEQIPGRIHHNDRYRTARALEVIFSGTVLWSEHWRRVRSQCNGARETYRFEGWILTPERNAYLDRLQERARAMIEAGLLHETQRIATRYGRDCPGLRTIGYGFALRVLDGSMNQNELEELLFISHRQYAKKQRTWFRKEEDLQRIAPEDFNGHLPSDPRK